MTSGCTSAKYGDVVARVKITDEGIFEIVGCECSPGGCCDEGTMKPSAFEKHAENHSKKWKNNIWVLRHNKKLPLCKTELLRDYKNNTRGSKPRVAHKDAAPPAGRSATSSVVSGRNAACTFWMPMIPIGSVLIFRMRELGVNWRKKEPPVERLTGAAARFLAVRGALSVSAWAVKSASSGTATVVLALTFIPSMPDGQK